MTDLDTLSIDLRIANEDEFRETLHELRDEIQAVREEVQALNDELDAVDEHVARDAAQGLAEALRSESLTK